MKMARCVTGLPLPHSLIRPRTITHATIKRMRSLRTQKTIWKKRDLLPNRRWWWRFRPQAKVQSQLHLLLSLTKKAGTTIAMLSVYSPNRTMSVMRWEEEMMAVKMEKVWHRIYHFSSTMGIPRKLQLSTTHQEIIINNNMSKAVKLLRDLPVKSPARKDIAIKSCNILK